LLLGIARAVREVQCAKTRPGYRAFTERFKQAQEQSNAFGNYIRPAGGFPFGCFESGDHFRART
jgi:hypothetical protein